jgi:hypothetical protein
VLHSRLLQYLRSILLTLVYFSYTSDHHPITITVQFTPKSISNKNTKNSERKNVKRVKWDKIYKTEYQNKINEKI